MSTGTPSRLLTLPLFVLIGTGGLTSTARWLEMLALGVFVFDRTGSALMVALMTVLRMLPLALLGVFIGAVAERLRRVPLLLMALGAAGFVSIALGYLAESGQIATWHLAVGAFLGGVFWSTDFPVRRTLISDAVAPGLLSRAMSVDVLINNGTRMLGPTLGGLLLQHIGLAGSYYVAAIAYLVSLVGVLLLRVDAAPRPRHGSVLVSMVEGLRYLRGERALTGILMVTIIFNVFGWPFLSMVPVIGREVFRLSASEIGLLVGAEGAGVLLGAVGLMLAGASLRLRRVYVFGCATYVLCGLALANSELVLLSGAIMLMTGIGGACFATMQSTLVMLLSAPHARTRMMGVLAVCIGTSPIGLLHVGWLSDVLGAPMAMSIMALEGVVALLLCYWFWPEILAPQRFTASRNAGVRTTQR